MAATKITNDEFELRGFNHIALVCRDMAETVAWYEDTLGMKLVKTLELPGGRGQHFFLDMGNGVDGIAFSDVAPDKLDDYLVKLRGKGVAVTEITNHCNSLDGGHKADYDPATDDGDVFVRSLYFKDPNGVLLEFACWTTTFDESDIRHAPATALASTDA